MPKVSVIMCVYNGARFLRECLDSYLQQSFRDYEFLIMDDGSTDETATIIKDYALRDPRIKYFYQNNSGRAVAANSLIALSTGEYIARMDADDFVSPDRLAEQVSYLDCHPEINLVTSGVAYFSNNRRLLFAVCSKDRDPDADADILSGRRNTLVHGSVMLRANALKEFPMPYRTQFGQDYDLWIRCLAKKWKFATVPKVLYFYRKGSELQNDDVKNAIRDGQRKAASRLLIDGLIFDDEYCIKEYAKVSLEIKARKRKRRMAFVLRQWLYRSFERYFWFIYPEWIRAMIYDGLFACRGLHYLKYRELKKLATKVSL